MHAECRRCHMPRILCVVIVIRHIFIIAHISDLFVNLFIYLCGMFQSVSNASRDGQQSLVIARASWIEVCIHHTGFWSLLRRRVNKVQKRYRNTWVENCRIFVREMNTNVRWRAVMNKRRKQREISEWIDMHVELLWVNAGRRKSRK